MSGAPPQQVFVHIGLHKTGTTYLQGALRANADELAAQGVRLPSADGVRIFRAVDDLQGRRPRATADARIDGAWPVLVDAVRGCGLPRAVFSDERLSLSGPAAIKRLGHAFEGSELNVVVTVRDLARVLVSSWEEAVRGGGTWPWQEYVDAVGDPARRGTNPARNFWVRQDLARICAAWEAAAAPERIHIVTVPPQGSTPRMLLDRFATCLGVDPDRLTREPRFAKESTGVAATEVVRRLNLRLGHRLNQRQYGELARVLEKAPAGRSAERGVLPAEELEWVHARAEQDRATVRERGYHLVGDLDDLLPAVPAGRRPDDAAGHELLDAALAALAAVGEQYARSAWARQQSRAMPPSAGGSVLGRTRGALFRARRTVLTAADRGGPLGRLISAAYRAREARQERAMRRARRSN
jgi:hypothetical protein